MYIVCFGPDADVDADGYVGADVDDNAYVDADAYVDVDIDAEHTSNTYLTLISTITFEGLISILENTP